MRKEVYCEIKRWCPVSVALLKRLPVASFVVVKSLAQFALCRGFYFGASFDGGKSARGRQDLDAQKSAKCNTCVASICWWLTSLLSQRQWSFSGSLFGRAICQLSQEEDDAPRVRLPVPITANFQSNRKTRKRKRARRVRKHQSTVCRCCWLHRNLIWCTPLIAITESSTTHYTWLRCWCLMLFFAVLPALLSTFHAILSFSFSFLRLFVDR